MEKTVVFIMGLGHSGSTLLGHFLGAHPKIFHVGEIPTPIKGNLPFRCQYCADNPCPVWGTILTQDYTTRYCKSYLYDQHRFRSLLSPIAYKLGLLERPGNLFQQLFQAMPEINVLIDKSLESNWIKWHSKVTTNFRKRYILLTRDLRGVVASRLRRYPELSIAAATEKQVRDLTHILNLYAKFPAEDKLTIKYETLVECPDQTGRELCNFVGETYVPSQVDYVHAEHHVIGGNLSLVVQARNHKNAQISDLENMYYIDQQNRDYYLEHKPGFQLDTRWKQELNRDMLQTFDKIGGNLNQRFGYH